MGGLVTIFRMAVTDMGLAALASFIMFSIAQAMQVYGNDAEYRLEWDGICAQHMTSVRYTHELLTRCTFIEGYLKRYTVSKMYMDFDVTTFLVDDYFAKTCSMVSLALLISTITYAYKAVLGTTKRYTTEDDMSAIYRRLLFSDFLREHLIDRRSTLRVVDRENN